MRRKVYTKDYILKQTKSLVEKEGFENLTARNIADKLSISTQPIYLEFKNMDDLKHQVLDNILEQLFSNTLNDEITGDSLIDVGLNFITFTQKKKTLFQTLFVENHKIGERVHESSLINYKRLIQKTDKYAHLSDKAIEILHRETLITVIGIATLSTSGILTYDQDYLIKILKTILEDIVEKPEKYY